MADQPGTDDSGVFYPGRTPDEIRRPKLSSITPQPGTERLGIPPDKFGALAVPMVTEQRAAVLFMLFPPIALRDASLDDIRSVVGSSAATLLETICLEIYKGFTSDAVDGTAARNAAEALMQFANDQRKG